MFMLPNGLHRESGSLQMALRCSIIEGVMRLFILFQR